MAQIKPDKKNNKKIPPRLIAPARTDAAAMTPKEIAATLRRSMWLIIICTFIGIIGGGTSWWLLKKYQPKYTARTFIEVLPPADQDPKKIESVNINKDIQYGYRVSKVNLLTQQSMLMELLQRDRVKGTGWFRNFGELEEVRMKEAFDALEDNFNAHPQRDGDYIIVSMTCGNPEEAALILNEMVDLFISSQGESARRDVTERVTRLIDQRLRLERELETANDALEQIRNRYGFVDLEERQFEPTITRKLNNLEVEHDQLQIEIEQVRTNMETLRRQAVGPVQEQVQRRVESDPVMLDLTATLANLRSALEAAQTRFGENHKVVRQLRQRITTTEQQRQQRKDIIAELIRQGNYQDAQDTLVAYAQRLEQLNRLREEAEAQQAELDRARVEYEKRVAIRDEIQKRLNEVKSAITNLQMLRDDPETPKVKLTGYAPVPLELSSPKLKLFLPGGTMLGLMMGVGLAFLFEVMNDLVRTPKDVGKHLHLQLLGIIPHAVEDDQINKNVDLYHVVRQAPYSVIAESYRRLRTNLRLSGATDSANVFLVTSGMAGDGKTSVAANLSTTLAGEKSRVLLVDTNFWQPNIHKIYPTPKNPASTNPDDQPDNPDQQSEHAGYWLSSILREQCTCKQAIRPTGIEGFDIVDAGPLPPNPAELLEGPQMQNFLNEQKQKYDFVILDGPPVLLVSDTKMLATLVGGTILVFNACSTKRGAAQRVIRELREVDAGIAGCILFAARSMKGGYFQEQFRSYQQYHRKAV